MVFNRVNYTFEGSIGGPTFSTGGPNANFYRNPYNL